MYVASVKHVDTDQTSEIFTEKMFHLFSGAFN